MHTSEVKPLSARRLWINRDAAGDSALRPERGRDNGSLGDSLGPGRADRATRCAAGFSCNYPPQRLTGLADIGAGGRFVKLDLAVRLRGPDCEVLPSPTRRWCESHSEGSEADAAAPEAK